MQGSHLAESEIIVADDDVAAIMAAAKASPAQDIEVWRDHRRLARFRTAAGAMTVPKPDLLG